MDFDLYSFLAVFFLIIGTGSFIFVLGLWFYLYPKRRRFLAQLKKKFGLEYSKKALVLRESILEGFYQNYKITMNPFASGRTSWILLRCFNSKNFLGVIKPRKLLKIFSEPIKLLGTRKELLTENVEFDTKFRIIAKKVYPISEIFPPSTQARLLWLIKKGEFETQILQEGIFFSFEKELQDISLVNFIFETLVEIAKNLGKKSSTHI